MNIRTQDRTGLRRLPQRGAMLVITAAILTTIMAFSVLVAGRSSVSALEGSMNSNDALQALLSAETGLQRAAKRISQGLSVCAAAAITETVVYPAAGGTNPPSVSTAITSFTTDFDNSTALTATQCRLQATATVTSSNVVRKISEIIDTSLFDTTSTNLNFNTGTPPTDWVFSGTSEGGVYYRPGGGIDGGCNAAAYVKETANAIRTTLADYNKIRFNAFKGTVTTNFTVTFQKRYVINNSSDNAGNTATFRLTDSAAATVSAAALNFGNSVVLAQPSADPPYGVGGCATNYAGLTTGNITIPTTVTNPITTVGFTMTLDAIARDKEAWIDNLVINAPNLNAVTGAGGSYTRVLQWRECVPAATNICLKI